jgi:hypothetical protein
MKFFRFSLKKSVRDWLQKYVIQWCIAGKIIAIFFFIYIIEIIVFFMDAKYKGVNSIW